MAKKIFTYKGKKLEELQALSVADFAKLLPSRERRTLKRGFTEAQKSFLEKVKKFKEGKRKKPVKTHCREMVVLPNMVGMTIHIHQGKTFVMVLILEDMIGHRLGEFTLTRNRVQHSAPGIGATRSSASVSVK
ncbi:MAG: 30S ribosomal protein S19 [Nanoarchaeota archaeon]|nr:30S ribosomal protein S19 [Nanoarchaeota archaeon]MBU4241887.1 30S ribosomal protein S19 [Nanoarchaeota archaeon]MBU4352475.1 30S ribosomal protein S19 [Nanoarchaeota archaeon]MBU4455996.1 30S ribosomal protein S19 [Nanoarchaeota archaeon]MCG2719415.1 30S ribosomal protein S19 [Nanoarchaeota archaeon]